MTYDLVFTLLFFLTCRRELETLLRNNFRFLKTRRYLFPQTGAAARYLDHTYIGLLFVHDFMALLCDFLNLISVKALKINVVIKLNEYLIELEY